MTANIISPYPYFTDTTGAALDAGSIYIGVAGADPRTSPVTVYQDEAGTVTWAQPLRTVLGYAAYQGSPARIFVSAPTHSIMVFDSRGREVFRNFSASSFVFASTLTGAGGAAAVGYTAYTTVQQKLSEFVTPYDYGAVGNGIADDTTAVQAALSSTAKHVYFPAGLFRVSATVTSAVDDRTIDGPGKLTATTPVAIAMTITGARNEVAVNIDGNEFIGVGVRFDGAVLPIVSGGRIRDLYSSTANCAGLFFSDTQAGFIVRGVTITDVNSPGNGTLGDSNGFSRAIAIGLSGDPTGNSVIEGCYIANIIGEEGDAIAGVSGGSGTYYRLDLTVKGNIIRGFTRRAVKTQGSNVRVIGNSISNDWATAAEVPNAATVIDFVQGGDCIARDNDLYGCDFFNQVSVFAVAGEAWNNILVAGNTFWGLTSDNTKSAVSITPTGSAEVTFTNGSANIVSTDSLPAIGAAIQLLTSGTLPTNFSTGTTYYVVSSVTVGSTTTITVSATPGGSAIVAGSAGSGVHTLAGIVTATGIVVRGNLFSGSEGRAVSIGRSVGTVVSDNIMALLDEGSTRTISFSSGASKALATGNIMTGGVRETFIANDGSNGVIADNHVKTNTPLFSNAAGSGNHLAVGNSVDGTASFHFDTDTLTGNRLAGNYNFAAQTLTAPGPLFVSQAGGPSVALSGLQVRTGQVVIDTTPTAGGKIGWTALASGDGASVTWQPFGAIDP